MTEKTIELLTEYQQWAIIISLLINVIVAILGIVPSVFLTGANILFFGFWGGTIISLAGEALGAAAAFIIYRKGLKKQSHRLLNKYPHGKKLLGTVGKEAFFLIISLRLLPFVPSGVVTLAAAIGAVSTGVFIAASTIGKIPALLIEAYSVYQITAWDIEGKIILGSAAVLLLFVVLKKRRTK